MSDEVSPAPPAASSARPLDDDDEQGRLPPWVIPATVVFWLGFLATLLVRHLWSRLDGLALLLVISLFLALAVEPGVNRLVRRGWRRGTSTAVILLGVLLAFLVFVAAIGTLVGSQVAELLQNSEQYITDTVDFLNDTFDASIESWVWLSRKKTINASRSSAARLKLAS